MRFDYETKQDDRECVAYLHSSGSLFLNAGSMYSKGGLEQGAACLGGRYSSNSKVRPNGTATLDEVIMNDGGRGKKFYPGDKLTITF